MREMMRDALAAIFKRLIERQGILRFHPGVSRYTLQKIAPYLRAELDRRILASANLIVLNREEAITKTLQRFSGWATSIPKGGAANPKKKKANEEIKKSVGALPFIERRVLIDQGHKLNSALSSIVATDNGAIAGRWFSHWRQSGYDYRPDHKERDGNIYLVRGSWAYDRGLVKSTHGFTDDITQPGEEVYCRCQYTYLYALRQLPPEMLTVKGKRALEEARA